MMIAAALIACFLCTAHALTRLEVAEFVKNKITITTVAGGLHRVSSNGRPDHEHGIFPNRDNPNAISNQTHSFSFPANPQVAPDSSCVSLGAVGVALNGVTFYNPYTAELSDALECEVLDQCGGHPDPRGNYHYHADPNCLRKGEKGILGVALDGFPIYRSLKSDGSLYTRSELQLDPCNGRDDGQGYRYQVTSDFPYVIGCYKGTADVRSRGACHKTSERPPVECRERGAPGSQGPGGQGSGGQNQNGPRPEGQRPGGQGSETQRPDGQGREGQSPGGQRPDSQRPGGQRPDGQRPGGQLPQGQRPWGQAPGGQQQEGQIPGRQRPPQGQRPENPRQEGQRPEHQRPARPEGQTFGRQNPPDHMPPMGHRPGPFGMMPGHGPRPHPRGGRRGPSRGRR